MIKSFQIILTVFTLLFVVDKNANGQEAIWPGDVNNNGQVNLIDALYLNAAWGEVGVPRSFTSTFWSPMPYTPWAQDIPGTSLNMALADCNGDGIVDDIDIEAIDINFGETNNNVFPDVYTEGEVGLNPKIEMEFLFEPNDELPFLTINFNNVQAIENLQGFVVNLDFNIEHMIPFEWDFFEESWLFEEEDDLLPVFPFQEIENDLFQYALIRRNIVGPASGNGTFLSLPFIIIDDVTALSESGFNTEVIIESAKFISESLNEFRVVYDTLNISIPKEEFDFLLQNKPVFNSNEIKVFPNPAAGNIHIAAGNLQADKVEVFNNTGQQLKSFSGFHQTTTLNLHNIEQGVYFLKIYTAEKVFMKKIILQ